MSETGSSGSETAAQGTAALRLRNRAVEIATSHHGSQRYGEWPYAVHLADVERVLMDHGFVAEHWRAAAWLHDVIEDTDATRDLIAAKFGEMIAGMVWAVTGEGATRGARNAAIYRKLGGQPAVWALKVADRIANVEAAANESSHMARYRAEQSGFALHARGNVPAAMWRRLEAALAPVGEAAVPRPRPASGDGNGMPPNS